MAVIVVGVHWLVRLAESSVVDTSYTHEAERWARHVFMLVYAAFWFFGPFFESDESDIPRS